MNKRKYVIPGDPTALARCRFSSKNMRVWDSQKELKLVTGINIKNQHNNTDLFEGPLCLDVTFFMEIPKTRIKQKNLPGQPHIYRPDIDNLLKFILDCCNKILYNDDCAIAKIIATKKYDLMPRSEFTIEEITIGEKR